MKIYTMY